MTCDYRLKGYCFHPDRATGKLVAINCVYDWLHKMQEEASRMPALENEEE